MHDHASFVCEAGGYKLIDFRQKNVFARNTHLQIQGKVEDVDVSKT